MDYEYLVSTGGSWDGCAQADNSMNGRTNAQGCKEGCVHAEGLKMDVPWARVREKILLIHQDLGMIVPRH
jgi:hypothetical protein